MKKIILSSILIGTMFSTLNADFIRVETGGGVTSTETIGNLNVFGEHINIDDTAGFSKNENLYLWGRIKHPVPILPNFQLEYSESNNKGDITNDITILGNTYPSGVSNELNLKDIDAIMYYNVLDNTFWMTFDFGLDVKFIDAEYKVKSNISGVEDYDYSDSVILPLGYVRGRVQVPFVNLAADGNIKYIAYQNNSLIDASLKVEYTMDFVPIVQPLIEVGYRYKKYDLDSGFDVGMELEYSGPFVGIGAKF